MEQLEKRREISEKRIGDLTSSLTDAIKIASGKACIYATGSFGRVEAGKHSDLDLHIVGADDGGGNSLLGKLDEICIKADIISTSRKLSFPDLDGDGAYLNHYALRDLIETLGKPEDDLSNTFTARLLLLLESIPLAGDAIYESILNNVISAYWRDYEDHKDDFIPAFLVNDILRLWRTLCVNYEARTQTQPERKKAKRKLKNYKLKHSRILTCYSSILCYLDIYNKFGSVSPIAAREISLCTPTKRIEGLNEAAESQAIKSALTKLLRQYEDFLMLTDAAEEELIQKIMNKTIDIGFFKNAYQFGETMSETVSLIGNGSRFYRMIVV